MKLSSLKPCVSRRDDSTIRSAAAARGGSGFLASLFLGVNKRHVPRSHEPQNAAQIGLLRNHTPTLTWLQSKEESLRWDRERSSRRLLAGYPTAFGERLMSAIGRASACPHRSRSAANQGSGSRILDVKLFREKPYPTRIQSVQAG